MKKIVSLAIAFLFVFNLLSSVFASQSETVDVGAFDSFSIDQIQKTFSNTLSDEKKSEEQNDSSQVFILSECIYNVSDFYFGVSNMSVNMFADKDLSRGLEYLYKYKLFERDKSLGGITEYKINLNSYIAIALVDIYGVIYYI